MTRVNVYAPADEWEDGYGPSDAKPELAGWFDPASAECFSQDKRWDGNNMVGVITGSQWIDEYLYRTKGGRWVLNKDAHRYGNGPDTYQFVNDAEARDWLLRSECNDAAIERFFGEIEEERGPGRPAIGGAVHIRLGEMVASVDKYAKEHELGSRADAVRELVMLGLAEAEAPLADA